MKKRILVAAISIVSFSLFLFGSSKADAQVRAGWGITITNNTSNTIRFTIVSHRTLRDGSSNWGGGMILKVTPGETWPYAFPTGGGLSNSGWIKITFPRTNARGITYNQEYKVMLKAVAIHNTDWSYTDRSVRANGRHFNFNNRRFGRDRDLDDR